MVNSGKTPDTVLLSMGGNDAHFADVVKYCVKNHHCPKEKISAQNSLDGKESTFEEQIMILVASLADNLQSAYRDVDRAVNDKFARDQRGGRVAPIVVVPYPRLLPDNKSPNLKGECLYEISLDEAKFLNNYVDAVNTQTRTAVETLRKKGAPVYYADSVVTAFQPDHTVCGNSSYGNTIRASDPISFLRTFEPENAHPNVEGYAAMARAILAWSKGQVEVQNPELPTWSDRIIRDLNGVLLASVGSITPTGGTTRVTGAGYAPDSNVVVQMHSTPRTLGSTKADQNGNIDVSVPLPKDASLGDHEVFALGLDSNGALHAEKSTIWVVPRYYLIAVVLFAIGLGATAFGAAGMVVSRKKR